MKDMKKATLAMLIATAMPLTITTTTLAGPDETKAVATDAPSMDAKAKKVWDRAIEVTMSENAEDEWVKSVRLIGTMSIPAQGITASMNVLIAPKQGLRAVIELPGMGVFEQGVSGDVAWSSDMMGGPKVLEGEEADQILKEMDLYADLHWDQYFQSISYKGEESVTMPDDTEVKTDVLELIDISTGESSTRFYDKDTGYLVKSVSMTSIPGGGKMPATAYTTDYREIDGVTMPFKTISQSGPIQQIIEFTEITINGEIGEDELELPEDVQDLLDD